MAADQSDEVETPVRAALAALERLVNRLPFDAEVSSDQSRIARLLYDFENEAEHIRIASEYVAGREQLASGRVTQLDRENRVLRGALHDCTFEMTALITSTRALCDRLDELEADELSIERRAVRVALSGERTEALQNFLNYSVQWSQVCKLLKRICRELNATPEFMKTAEKWMYERLANVPKDWWSDTNAKER